MEAFEDADEELLNLRFEECLWRAVFLTDCLRGRKPERADRRNMNWIDIAVLTVLACLAILIIRYRYKLYRQGQGGCGYGCAGCRKNTGCGREQKEKRGRK